MSEPMNPDAWPYDLRLAEPTLPEPPPVPAKPWSITVGTAVIAAILALEIARHDTVLIIGASVFLTSNTWLTVRAWHDYRRAARTGPAEDT